MQAVIGNCTDKNFSVRGLQCKGAVLHCLHSSEIFWIVGGLQMMAIIFIQPRMRINTKILFSVIEDGTFNLPDGDILKHSFL